jgi:hypothetical protein
VQAAYVTQWGYFLHLKPCLVIGSGFHRWVLGNTTTPLTDWNALISETASRMRVALPSSDLPPVLRWERLIETAATDGYQPSEKLSWVSSTNDQAYKVEVYARKIVAQILCEERDRYPQKSRRANYPKNDIWGSVISLNFDISWLGQEDNKGYNSISSVEHSGIKSSERKRLGTHIQIGEDLETKVWFPNGSVLRPSSIRMGLHDYGTQPHAIKSAFSHLKKYEYRVVPTTVENRWAILRPLLVNAISRGDEDLNTWVADFLYRPLFFAGVGLSESEIGLWWLLVQRARNLMKVKPEDKPSTVVLVDANCSSRSFWNTRPCGIEPIYCDNWDYGWDELIRRASDIYYSDG